MKNLFKTASANENFAGFLFLEGGPNNPESNEDPKDKNPKNKEKRKNAEIIKDSPKGKAATEENNKILDSINTNKEDFNDEITNTSIIGISNKPGYVNINTTTKRTYKNGFTQKDIDEKTVKISDLNINDLDVANRLFSKTETIESSKEVAILDINKVKNSHRYKLTNDFPHLNNEIVLESRHAQYNSIDTMRQFIKDAQTSGALKNPFGQLHIKFIDTNGNVKYRTSIH